MSSSTGFRRKALVMHPARRRSRPALEDDVDRVLARVPLAQEYVHLSRTSWQGEDVDSEAPLPVSDDPSTADSVQAAPPESRHEWLVRHSTAVAPALDPTGSSAASLPVGGESVRTQFAGMPLVLLADASAAGGGGGLLASASAGSGAGAGVAAALAVVASALALKSPGSAESAAPRTIRVIDGYVRGAQIYIDTNRDGVADDNELVPGALTDDLGSFTLPVGSPQAPLIATGGTNLDTGLPNRMVLLAPEGSAVLTPLTTLAQQMILNGWAATPAAAANKVVRALGIVLPEGTDLLSYDPVGAQDLEVLRTGVSVATLADLANHEYKGRGSQALSVLARELAASSDADATIDLLSFPASLRTALDEVGLGAAAANSVGASLSSLRSATSFKAVAAVQGQVLSSPTPVAPVFELAPTYTTVKKPSGLVQLASGPVPAGSRAVAVDDMLVLSLYEGERLLGVRQVVLQAADIIDATVPIEVPVALGEGRYRVEGFIDDPLGFQSPIASFDFEVDAVAAQVLQASVNAEGKPLNNSLPAGTRVTVSVVFDGDVTVSGSPTLAMRIGGRDAIAQYQRDASTARTLVFEYRLQRSGTGIEIAADALDVGGASIEDELGRSASLAIPPVFAHGLVFKADGVEISAQSPYLIGERAGDSKAFSVALGGKPTAEVILVLESGDATEVVLSHSRGDEIATGKAIALEFTASNWNKAQVFNLKLVDDQRFDTPFAVPIFASTRSNDPAFNGLAWGDGLAGSAFDVKGLPVFQGALLLTLDGLPFDPSDTVSLVANEGNSHVDARQLEIALSRAPLETVWLELAGAGDDFAFNGLSPETGTTLKFSAKDWDKPVSVVLEPARFSGLLASSSDELLIKSRSADPYFNDLEVKVSINAADVALSDDTASPAWGGVDARAVNAIQSSVKGMLDRAVGKALPLIGNLGEQFVSTLANVLAPSNLDFTFDQSNNTFKLRIDKSVDLFDIPLASDLGFSIGNPDAPIVALDLDARAQATVNARLMIEGQIDTLALNDGRWGDAVVLRPFDAGPSNSLQDDAGSQLRLDLSLAVPGAMRGTLGPLTVTASDQNAVNPRLSVDQGTGVNGWIDVNLIEDGVDAGVRVGDLIGEPAQALALQSSLRGQVSSRVEASLQTGISFFDFFLPSISFDLGIPFLSLSSETSAAATEVLIDNVTLDLGGVFDYVTPVLRVLDPILQTIRPVVDVFQEDILKHLTVTPYAFNQDEWNFWDYVFPAVKLIREGVKAGVSALAADMIVNKVRSLDGSVDGEKDGEVNLLEVVVGAASLAERTSVLDPRLVKTLQTVRDLAPTLQEISDYFNLYYSISERLRDERGLIGLDSGISMGSLVISANGIESSAKSGETSVTPGASSAPGAWVAVPAAGQKTLPTLDELISELSPEVAELIQDISKLGVTFPLLSDNTLIGKIVMLEPVDLVEFRPNIPDLEANVGMRLFDTLDVVADTLIPGLSNTLTAFRKIRLPGADPVKLEAPVSLEADFSLKSQLAVGLDTGGINAWVKNGMRFDLAGAADLLDGLYLSDNVVNGVDQPEFSGTYDLKLLVELLIGGRDYGVLFDANAGLGVGGGFELDLEDAGEQSGNSDGKIRPSEFMAGLANAGSDGELDFSDVIGNLMPGGPIYNFDVDAAGKADVNVAFSLDLANSYARKLVNTLLQPIKVLPFVGEAVYWLGTIGSDVVAAVPKIELEVGASNEFPIFDTRAGQPVLFV